MGWTSRLLLLSLLGLATCQQRSIGGTSRSRNRVTGKTEILAFNCPEDFGYYPHPSDCTQYYVCVFGGALQESCTGGLMYSHELQTCDWPRNVICTLSTGGVSTVRITDPRTSASTPIRPATESVSLTPSVGSFSGSSSFPSQASQATDLFPVRIQGGNVRDGRDFTSQPSQQSLAQQTIAHVSRFPQTKALQESSISSVFKTNNPGAFQAPQRTKPTPAPVRAQTPRPTPRQTSRSTPRPSSSAALSFDDSFYPNLNFTDADYYYYYDDLLYDYYDAADFTATSTAAPPRPQATTARTRVSSSSTSTSRGRSSSSRTDSRSGPSSPKNSLSSSSRNSLRSLPKTSSSQVTPISSSLRAVKKPSSQTPSSRSSRISLPKTPTRPTSLPITGTRTSSKISTSQRLRSSSAPSFPSVSKSRTPFTPSLTSSSSSTFTSSSLRTGTPAPKTPPTTTSRPSSRGTPPPSRRSPSQASSGPVATDNSIATRSRRPTLKPVNVIAPSTSEAIDIFKFPARRPAALYPTPPLESKATQCDSKVCRLPDCSCGGTPVPGGIAPQDTPQMVLLTFDDSINDLNKGHYEDLFNVGRKNPNGCPIQATFYVSHEWTDYGQVQSMYSDGHEMASHSITHSFGEQFSTKKWAKEVAGQREILSAYGGVKMEDVRGMRAPFLAIGGNNMFKMLHEQNFTYDSSMPVYENNPPSWPYTLDYKVFHDCMIPPCPTLSYPGVWQVPMVMWQDLNGGRCSMGDACTTPPDAEGVYKMLIKNFERHYTTNRAPFGLFYHAAWFTTPHHKEGFIAFLDTITAMDDVWLTTNWQALQYVRDPVSLSTVKNYKPFQCNYPDRPPRCDRPKVCNVWHKGGVRYMRTCMKCPEKYPWTGNTGVRSPLNDL